MTTPSIQSFYPKERAHPRKVAGNPAGFDNGFTSSELGTHNPLHRDWEPSQSYEVVSISNVPQGKNHIHFAGRLVNFRPAVIDAKTLQYMRPYHYLVIKDDTGAIGVKLTPLGIPDRTFSLGQVISIWATYVCEPPSNYESVPYVLTCTPINPQSGTHQFLRIETETAESQLKYRLPLDWVVAGSQSKGLQGLVTLGSYLKTGHDDVNGLRLLVCVRSIGNRRRIRPANRDTDVELQEVTVFDHTASCTLTLWESHIDSACYWRANDTILLISSPKWKPRPPAQIVAASGGNIGIDLRTLIDVDPVFSDALWLRSWAQDRNKKEQVSMPFPSDIWDVQSAKSGAVRALFTVAEVEQYARSDPHAVFTGKLSVVILEVNLIDLWFKKALFCIDCCGVPTTANSPNAICRHCSTDRNLRFNPRIVGIVADETGCLERGKQIWNSSSWHELLYPGDASRSSDGGCSEEEETRRIWKKATVNGQQTLKEIESLLLYARVTLTFGWSTEVGRLCVLGVEW